MSETTTIYHNAACSKSRAAMAELAGREVRVINYLATPPSRAELLELLSLLVDEPSALVRRDAAFTAAGLTGADVDSAEQVATVLAEHPELMERPVIVARGHAIIGRPSSRVREFLAEG